ncbi:MAG: hypothetical protein M1816_005761 [Peltula sp. TS41687]|nr:MAG: hypothetical protein M1816_005761 [Peltula sp. TS41687]
MQKQNDNTTRRGARKRRQRDEGSSDGFVYTPEILREIRRMAARSAPSATPAQSAAPVSRAAPGQPGRNSGHVLEIDITDAKTEVDVVGKDGRSTKVPNRPSDHQLSSAPDANGQRNYYVELPHNHPRNVDWRESLGYYLAERTGLAKRITTKQHENCILEDFPPGWRLYEHVKSKVSTGSGKKGKDGDKSQAEDEEDVDRRDAYLYGHPFGPQKRYRSPMDFLDHLLWLARGPPLDHNDCSCVICSPDQSVPSDEAAEKTEKTADAKAGAEAKSELAEKPKREDSTKPKPRVLPSTTTPHLVTAKPRRPRKSKPAKASSTTTTEEPNHRPPPLVSTPASIRAARAAAEASNMPPPLLSTVVTSHVPTPLLSSAETSHMATPLPSTADTSYMPPPVVAPAASTRAPTSTGPMPAMTTPRGNITPFGPRNVPGRLPAIRHPGQEIDARYGHFIFRPGELVWFHRRASTWGLACVVQRQDTPGAPGGPPQDEPRYLIQPLSHPYGRPPADIYPESAIRPWLTWSSPPPTHEALRVDGLTFDTVDWPAVIRGEYGLGDDEVDGSIFAAKAVEASYTLIGKIPPVFRNSTSQDTYYAGMFIGAEKVWIGEAVRIRTETQASQAIMVIHHIIERPQAGANNNRIVHLVGDVYTFVTYDLSVNANPVLDNNPHRPARLVTDLDFYNEKTRNTKNTVSTWRFAQTGRRLTLADVKGRWYEASLILPLIRGKEDFAKEANEGNIGDVGRWMNARFDSGGAARPQGMDLIGVRKETREEAYGLSIHASTRFPLGTEGEADTGIFATMGVTMGTTPANPIVLGGEVDVAQFMDLDLVDDLYGPA